MIRNKIKFLLEEDRKVDFFLDEIFNLCEFVFMSEELLNKAKENKESARSYFYAITNMFTALANISKIIYPKRDDAYTKRGQLLREKLGIQSDTQFHYNRNRDGVRKYRNILEHYDEYFEDWYDNEQNNYIIDYNVGSFNISSGITLLRNFNPSTNEFIFLDDTYNINVALEETRVIYEKIKDIKDKKINKYDAVAE